MEIRTYRAASIHEALRLVRQDLGPEAVVLQTRETRSRRWLGLLSGPRQIEITASVEVNGPRRQTAARTSVAAAAAGRSIAAEAAMTGVLSARINVLASLPASSEPPARERVEESHARMEHLARDLRRRPGIGCGRELPEAFFRLYTDLIEADVDEETACRLIERTREETPAGEEFDVATARSRLAGILESRIAVTGPIEATRGSRRLVALVGPTGVGKTTTIAKLAAHYRLKREQNVGLITVDTYRIAAVEQLRTYADIIDLPMQVVSTPSEMREAVRRLSGMDLVLMDTAGRSPRDEVQIQELKSLLAEAGADEVHLVLSSASGSKSLLQTVERFASVGTTALILTKLDEAPGLGNLLPVLQGGSPPLSYLTNGQNVPDDIETAETGRVVELILSGRGEESEW